MQQPREIIRTKLHAPFVRRELVDRPRLQEQVLGGLNGPLTLITAPAGFRSICRSKPAPILEILNWVGWPCAV